MSLMQDYEEARDLIGHKKYDAISKYLDIVCPQEKCDRYFEAVNKNVNLPIEKQIYEQRKLEKEMGIVFLSDVLYKIEEWEKFDKWYNEDYLHRKVEIVNMWESSNEDVRANAILYQNNKMVANVVIDFPFGENHSYSERQAKSVAYCNFDKYVSLPKISKCSKLLQEIYDVVCQSDSSMCFIDEENWKDDYSERYTDKDILRLKEEVKKYGLDDVITFDYDDCKIIGYGNVETSFNDYRDMKRGRDYER